jgi:hypothetical protein
MALNTTGAAANSSAMLDVSSSTKGVLVPRMLSSLRTAIASPATGLLVYQTDPPAGFYQYNGSGWVSLISDSATAGGDLTGKYPIPTIASTSSAGSHAVAAINAGTSVINPANLGSGTPTTSKFLRGDGTWNTPTTPSNYTIPLASVSRIGLTTTSAGISDSVAVMGIGVAGNQLININAGTYIDPSNTYPMAAIPVATGGTITSFSFFFKVSNPSPFFTIFGGTYTFEAKLYYSAPPVSTLIGAEQFFPVTGATISVNLNAVSGGILIQSETIPGSVSGLSFPISAQSRLMVLIDYNVSTPPASLQTLQGYATASVGMQ